MYEYKCKTVHVIDGNTIDAEIDLGFNILIKQRIKLFGITPICSQQNNSCRNRLSSLVGDSFYCCTVLNKRGKAGRVLGHIYIIDVNGKKIDVNKLLVDEGLASSFGE